MRYCFIFFLYYCCCACQSAESTSIAVDRTPIALPQEANLTRWEQELLVITEEIQDTIAQELYIKSLPKLPGGSSFFGNLQLNALQHGSNKCLKRLYQNISTPYRNNAYQRTKHLDLSYKNIYYIPNKVANYPNLRYLSLSNNRIQALNPKLAYCKKLRKLDLSSNGLTSLPTSLHLLTQIDELVLADNRLNSLPASFANLKNLKTIDISNLHTGMSEFYNNITKFPSVLTRMSNVEKLFLEKLPIRSLPSSIRNMTKLQVLSLNGNRSINLNQAFDALANVPDLIALDVSFMGRRTLPQSIQKLKNLKILVWHEENQGNRIFIEETLKLWLPNTKIYYGKKGMATLFLRGNTVTTIRSVGDE
jgi:Leucine-rich repeat (LRR) protein